MKNSFLGIGTTGPTLHLVKEKELGRGLRRSQSRAAEPSSEFGKAFEGFLTASAMSQAEFAELLSIALGIPVSQVNVSNWRRGVEPRARPDFPDFRQSILSAAKLIATNETAAGRRKFADKKAVLAQFLSWESLGLTPKQIQIAGEISVSLYRAWRQTDVKIHFARWEVFRNKVNLWQDFITERQQVWKLEAKSVVVPRDAEQKTSRGKRHIKK